MTTFVFAFSAPCICRMALLDPWEKSLFDELDVVKGVIHGETPPMPVLR